MPDVKTDHEAIEEYESSQAARAASDKSLTASDRLCSRKWVKGRSSIYVDAFNLALETVIAEESHLFDDVEKEVFDHWFNELSYEAKYL